MPRRQVRVPRRKRLLQALRQPDGRPSPTPSPRLLGTVILPMSKFKDQYIEIRRGLYTGKVEEGKGISRLIKEGETAAYETLGLKDVQLTGNFNGGPAVRSRRPILPIRGLRRHVNAHHGSQRSGERLELRQHRRAPTCASTSIPIWRIIRAANPRSTGSTSAMPRCCSTVPKPPTS